MPPLEFDSSQTVVEREITVDAYQFSAPQEPFGARLPQKQNEKVRDSLGEAILALLQAQSARENEREERAALEREKKERRRREEQESAALEKDEKEHRRRERTGARSARTREGART